MLNKELGTFPIGPEGKYGTVSVAIVEGKLVSSVALSPKAALDAAAAHLPGGAIPQEVAQFLENAVGLG